jgi:hypothetical protein
MDPSLKELGGVVPASRLLGWLNFSDGRPDPKWQRQLDDAYHFLISRKITQPWPELTAWLRSELEELQKSGNPAFQDAGQARATLALVFEHLWPAYRRHHADLLAHLDDADLFTPFVVARMCEALLAQGSPWEETDRIVEGALRKLNDYIGYRPVAVLERRAHPEVYAHEKVRPVPIYLQGAGAAEGRYHELVTGALDLLRKTDADLLAESCFDPELLDELAYDPRAYEHGHPVNRRPNNLFGEWDPHHIDNKGKYRRFVVRKTTLDAILARVPEGGSAALRAERKFEAAAVLAGTILMAAGSSGSGPNAFDSTVTLSKLVPRIARYRDSFYKRLITAVGGKHGERLRTEAVQMRQPFASARQHLNQELARQRAVELQESLLALALAEMGYPEASRQRAAKIPAASVRILAEMRIRVTGGQMAVEQGQRESALQLLTEAEELLHRGIECGALADPWNALGFQGLFPLFQSREDSVRDERLDDLIELVGRIFHLYSSALAGAASAGEVELRQKLSRRMERLARWWDKFATYEVSDLPRVHGGERTAAAKHVAEALAGVRAAGPAPGNGASPASDLAYWRQHRDGFQSPAAFAQVVDALLHQKEFRAAMALLMTWLSEAATVPLEEGEASFHFLARRWLTEISASSLPPSERIPLKVRFLELTEANADELWGVPEWSLSRGGRKNDDERFESAYEGMTYHDSAEDGGEGSVLGGATPGHFPLEDEAERLEDRLAFLTTVAVLWRNAGELLRPHLTEQPALGETCLGWLRTARSWQPDLLKLLDDLHELEIPEPVGGFEDVMEYDRRRMLREQLAETVIDTCLEVNRAVRVLAGYPSAPAAQAESPELEWERLALKLESALGRQDAAGVRRVLPEFVEKFQAQPLLFVPMSAGGHPRQILASRQAQAMLQYLLERLPRLGLIRETYHLIKLARTMEQNATAEGRKISEFDRLFPIALQSALEALLDAAHVWSADHLVGDDGLVELLRRITDSFLSLWLAHSQTLRLSVLESLNAGSEWEELREFIKNYGGDIFTPQFLALANLRSVLHRGLDNWLDSLAETLDAPKLIADMDRRRYPRRRAIAHMDFIVQALIEHHEEYRDYNSTTTQSDYGENLYYLLDFLKLKTNYERYAWRLRPLVQAHAVLCRRGQDDAAVRWQRSMAEFTGKVADSLLEDLEKLEREHGLRLRTIRDRLEERFVQPLVIDRLCSFVEPAMREAAQAPPHPALAKLEDQLRVLTERPIGIGLDPPVWLERLQEEVERVREQKAGGEPPAPRGLAPGVSLSHAELERQLADWEQPL